MYLNLDVHHFNTAVRSPFLLKMFVEVVILGFAVFMYFVYSISSKLRASTKRHAPPLPEAGGAWPLIGHLHLFGLKAPHIILGDLADKYGPIFEVKLGSLRIVIVSNSDVAKECFTTYDKALGGRMKNLASEILGYNYAVISLGPGGSHWRQVRKVMTLDFFSNQKLEILKRVGESEVRDFVRNIIGKSRCSNNETKVAVVDIWRWFEDINMSVIFRMLAGKSYLEDKQEEEKHERFEKAFNALFELGTKVAMAGSLPFMLRWLFARGIVRDLKRAAEDLDRVLQGWVEEHKHKRMFGKVKGKEDFIYAILSFLDDDAEEVLFDNYDSDTFIKATCLALIMGAVDATSLTLTWALSLLLNNPDVMKKSQQELDAHVGKERQVQASDLENLVYLQAILKETLRLYPPGPLNAPHQATEDCTISGYHVPAGTTIMVNSFKIHRDPNTWPDPNAFKPERFLTGSLKDFDFRGHNYELIPFSAGRRMCPGISYGLQVMQLILANLLHGFDIVNAKDEQVDLTESAFFNNFKKTKVQVILSPRLPAHVYD